MKMHKGEATMVIVILIICVLVLCGLMMYATGASVADSGEPFVTPQPIPYPSTR